MDKFVAVDADSIDVNIRNTIIKASQRTGIKFVFVADRILNDIIGAKNRKINVDMVKVESKKDSADDYIFSQSDNIYFCISHDVLLSSRLAEKNIRTLDKRGNITDKDNFKFRESNRNINMALREDGLFTNVAKPFSKKDMEKFSNALFIMMKDIK